MKRLIAVIALVFAFAFTMGVAYAVSGPCPPGTCAGDGSRRAQDINRCSPSNCRSAPAPRASPAKSFYDGCNSVCQAKCQSSSNPEGCIKLWSQLNSRYGKDVFRYEGKTPCEQHRTQCIQTGGSAAQCNAAFKEAMANRGDWPAGYGGPATVCRPDNFGTSLTN